MSAAAMDTGLSPTGAVGWPKNVSSKKKTWPELLAFWGLPNLQVINRDVHVEKCAGEATYRRQRPADIADDAIEV